VVLGDALFDVEGAVLGILDGETLGTVLGDKEVVSILEGDSLGIWPLLGEVEGKSVIGSGLAHTN